MHWAGWAPTVEDQGQTRCLGATPLGGQTTKPSADIRVPGGHDDQELAGLMAQKDCQKGWFLTMKGPMSELDPRFSDPDAVATRWEEARTRLEQAQLSWISTVRSDGRPHVTPLVSVWHDGAAYFATGPGEQKAVNLRQNPYVVLSTGCNDWSQGLDVMIEGRAERVTNQGLIKHLAELWAKKWDGQWQFEPREDGFFHEGGGVAHVFEVVPTKILAFGKGTSFSHTRHLFSL